MRRLILEGPQGEEADRVEYRTSDVGQGSRNQVEEPEWRHVMLQFAFIVRPNERTVAGDTGGP